MSEKIILDAGAFIERGEVDGRSPSSRGLSHSDMLPISSHLLDSHNHLTLSGLLVTLTTAIDLPVRFPEQLPERP